MHKNIVTVENYHFNSYFSLLCSQCGYETYSPIKLNMPDVKQGSSAIANIPNVNQKSFTLHECAADMQCKVRVATRCGSVACWDEHTSSLALVWMELPSSVRI